jgi:hypothetical protein
MAAVYPFVNWFFQQVNAPSHKARILQEWFHENYSEFSLVQWHLWEEMERAISD